MPSRDTCDEADDGGVFDGCGIDDSMEGGREQGRSVAAFAVLEEDNIFDWPAEGV